MKKASNLPKKEPKQQPKKQIEEETKEEDILDIPAENILEEKLKDVEKYIETDKVSLQSVFEYFFHLCNALVEGEVGNEKNLGPLASFNAIKEELEVDSDNHSGEYEAAN